MGGASEGSFAGMQRSSTEELFLRTIIEGSSSQANIGDVMGLFPSASPGPTRTPSEALFQNWLTGAEPQQQQQQQEQQQQQQQQQQAPPVSLVAGQLAHAPSRPRYLTRRISSELNAVIQQSQEMARNSSRESVSSPGGAPAEGQEAPLRGGRWQPLNGRGLAGLGGGRLGPGPGAGAAGEQRQSQQLREEDRQAATLAAAANILTLFPQHAPMTRSRSNELRRLAQNQGVELPSTDELLLQLAHRGELGAVLANLQGLSPSVGQHSGSGRPLPPVQAVSLPPLQVRCSSPSQGAEAGNSPVAAHGPTQGGREAAPPPSLGSIGRRSSVSAVVSLLKGNIERKKQQATRQQGGRGMEPGQWNICQNSSGSATSGQLSAQPATTAVGAAATEENGSSGGAAAAAACGGSLEGGIGGQLAASGEIHLQLPPTRLGVGRSEDPQALSPRSHLSPSASALSPSTELSPMLSPAAGGGLKGSPGSRPALPRGLPSGGILEQHLPPVHAGVHSMTTSVEIGGIIGSGRQYGGAAAQLPPPVGDSGGAHADTRPTGGSAVTGPRTATPPGACGAARIPLSRSASVTSSGNSGQGPGSSNPASRHHRSERQRKMAEAKGRGPPGSAGATGPGAGRERPPPPDAVQQQLKRRVEQLETENRSLKTFQSFINRKDSEQTTRIEALEADNAALAAENERLAREVSHLQALYAAAPPRS